MASVESTTPPVGDPPPTLAPAPAPLFIASGCPPRPPPVAAVRAELPSPVTARRGARRAEDESDDADLAPLEAVHPPALVFPSGTSPAGGRAPAPPAPPPAPAARNSAPQGAQESGGDALREGASGPQVERLQR